MAKESSSAPVPRAATIAGVLATIAFMAVTAAVLTGAAQPADEAALLWLADHRTPSLDEIMEHLTGMGDGAVRVVVVAIAATLFWQARGRHDAYLLLGGTAGANALSELLKRLIARPRPTVVAPLETALSPSFPSGHAMNSLVIYGLLAYLVTRLEPTRSLRRTTWTAAALVVAAVGVSRSYLGVHYPSDVAAGYAAGVAWTVLVVLAARRFTAPGTPAIYPRPSD